MRSEADGKEADRPTKIRKKNDKRSAKLIAEEDSASRAPGTPSPAVEPDPPITLPTNWEEEDNGLSAAILARDYELVCDLYDRYVKSFDKDSPTLYKILKLFDREAHVLLRRLPNPPAIDDDDKELSPSASQAIIDFDEEAFLGIMIHTAYLLRTLLTGMLPETCWVNEYRVEQEKSVEEKRLNKTCVWYTERFGKDEIPFDQWVNEYRVEQEKSVEEKRLNNNFAKNSSVGKSDAVDEDSSPAMAMQDKQTAEACDAYVTQPEASLPAHFVTQGNTVRLVDYPSSECNDEAPPVSSRSIRAAKLHALAATKSAGPPAQERSPERLQLNYSLRGRRLSERVAVEAAQIDTEDSLDDEDYIDGNVNGKDNVGDGDNSDNDSANASNDEEEIQEKHRKRRRRTKGKALTPDAPEDREELNGTHGGRGPLPREAKARLDALMAKLEEDVDAIAQEFGKPPEMCFKYIDGGDGSPTRSVTYWNIWQQWYGVHGQQKKPQNMPVSEWTGVVRNELETFLHSKLSDKDFDKPEARERALEEQTNWFWEHHDALIGETIARGKGNGMVTKILWPIVQMANRVYRETGFHIGGYAWHPDAGSHIFVGTQTLQKVKATKSTQMLSQVDDIGLQIAVAKLVERKVDSELAELYRHCIAKKEPRDRHRSMIPRIFTYDLNRIFEEGDVPKLNFANFVESAWKHQVRVTNWPAGVAFLHVGVRTKKGFVTGVSALNKYKASDLTKICGPRMEQIQQAVNGKEVDEDLHYFEIERWTDEERALSKDQWSTIPVVSDTANNTVVSVAHSLLYHKEGGITKDTVVSLFADDSDDDDLPGGRIDSRLSRESRCVSFTSHLATASSVSGIPESGNAESGNAESGNTDSGNTDSGNTDSGNTDSGNTGSSNTDSGNTSVGVALSYQWKDIMNILYQRGVMNILNKREFLLEQLSCGAFNFTPRAFHFHYLLVFSGISHWQWLNDLALPDTGNAGLVIPGLKRGINSAARLSTQTRTGRTIVIWIATPPAPRTPVVRDASPDILFILTDYKVEGAVVKSGPALMRVTAKSNPTRYVRSSFTAALEMPIATREWEEVDAQGVNTQWNDIARGTIVVDWAPSTSIDVDDRHYTRDIATVELDS
ncbi:hypothetical protein BDP27DRAFT_1376104 [Rhodocollybia butyracea]|uniref:Uncharacterized protein n=1 Tax=Rhodocollybia butyracea TaxID=206335 RepID=A0A9P5P3W2_9AGAR|nr:hypothetical protein BDP27DRAFT_1376104 [Rhodocollybia butyracea]